MLHVGTLAAVLVAYREAIGRLIVGGISAIGDTRFWEAPEGNAQYIGRTQVYMVDYSSVLFQQGSIAVVFKTQLESFFDEVRLVSVMLILTGVILQFPPTPQRKDGQP